MSKKKNLNDIDEREYPIDCYANRELSWLKFNERVLEEAQDPSNPLCEQLNFLNIFQSNLDEFFMVRVSTLYDERKSDARDNKSNMTSREQLNAVLPIVRKMLKAKDKCYHTLISQLKMNGIEILSYEELSGKEKRQLNRYFLTHILPLLSPQIVTANQPFPFLPSEAIYTVSLLEKKTTDEKKKEKSRVLGIIPSSGSMLKRLVPVSAEGKRYILVEDVIREFVPAIFEQYHVVSSCLIRLIRNADISIDDDQQDDLNIKGKDYRKAVERMVAARKRMGAIKLEYTEKIDANLIAVICDYLKLPKKHAFYSDAPLDLSFLYTVSDMLAGSRELFYQPRVPQLSPDVSENENIIDQIRRKDILLTYPYESMRPFLRLLNEAANDPEVVSIRITLYRVAKISQVVAALAQAAENGKDVLVLVELRARFDEANNVDQSHELEKSGCRIIYGLDKYKVHSKLCLITRKNADGVEYITQIGTGNYNEKTARLYTDYCLMTANPSIGEEAANVFTALALGETVEHTDTLLVAPNCLQNKILEKLDRQIALAKAGKPAYAGFKLNSLTDKTIIDKLIEASAAGVKIQMLVRGICCLVTGVPGLTDNIEVYSIVGRYLEHGRVYIFGCDGEEEVYIASADLMTRNTERRVEVAVPVYDSDLRNRLLEYFRLMLSDTCKLRVQQDDGTYVKVTSEERCFNSQEYFAENSYRRAGVLLPEEAEAAAAGGSAPAAEITPIAAEGNPPMEEVFLAEKEDSSAVEEENPVIKTEEVSPAEVEETPAIEAEEETPAEEKHAEQETVPDEPPVAEDDLSTSAEALKPSAEMTAPTAAAESTPEELTASADKTEEKKAKGIRNFLLNLFKK